MLVGGGARDWLVLGNGQRLPVYTYGVFSVCANVDGVVWSDGGDSCRLLMVAVVGILLHFIVKLSQRLASVRRSSQQSCFSEVRRGPV